MVAPSASAANEAKPESFWVSPLLLFLMAAEVAPAGCVGWGGRVGVAGGWVGKWVGVGGRRECQNGAGLGLVSLPAVLHAGCRCAAEALPHNRRHTALCGRLALCRATQKRSPDSSPARQLSRAAAQPRGSPMTPVYAPMAATVPSTNIRM